MVILKEVDNMFWGLTLEHGKRYSQTVEKGFHISMAALEQQSDTDGGKHHNTPLSVWVAHGTSEFLLCTLNHKYTLQQPLDLNFTDGEQVTFFVNGHVQHVQDPQGMVHLTGYNMEDDEGLDETNLDDMQLGSDDEDDSDEAPELVPGGRKRKKKTKEGISKKIKWVTPGGGEYSDEESDSDDDDEDSALDDEDDFADESGLIQFECEDEDDDEEDSDDDDDHDESEDDTPVKSAKKGKETPNVKGKQTPNMKGKDTPNLKNRHRILVVGDDEEDDEEDSDDDYDDDESEDDTPVKSANKGKETPNVQGKQTPNMKGKETPNVKGKQTPIMKGKDTPNMKDKPTPKDGKKKQEKKNGDTPKVKAPEMPATTVTPGGDASLSKKKKKKKKKGQDKEESAESANKTASEEKRTTPKGKTPKKQVLAGGIVMEETKVGAGNVAKKGKMVHVFYVGKLGSNGKQFDSCMAGKPFRFKLGMSEVIQGWDHGVEGMKVGGKRRLTIPPQQAYGSQRQGPIPPNSTLVFDIELKNVS